jgi:hypothetical protein
MGKPVNKKTLSLAIHHHLFLERAVASVKLQVHLGHLSFIFGRASFFIFIFHLGEASSVFAVHL